MTHAQGVKKKERERKITRSFTTQKNLHTLLIAREKKRGASDNDDSNSKKEWDKKKRGKQYRYEGAKKKKAAGFGGAKNCYIVLTFLFLFFSDCFEVDGSKQHGERESERWRQEGEKSGDSRRQGRRQNKNSRPADGEKKKTHQSLATQSVLRATKSIELSVVQNSRSVALRPLQLF